MGTLHPALVHLPIGILSLYTLAELLRLGKFFNSEGWYHSKAFMVLFGVLGGFAAFSSGDALEHLYGETPLLETHAFFAGATLSVYGALATQYIISLTDTSRHGTYIRKTPLKKIWHTLTILSGILRKPKVSIVLALFGFILLTITGALGGAIVRGREADPLVTIIYDIFVR